MLILAGLALSTFFRKHTGRKINLGVALPWIALCTSASFVVSLLWIDASLSNFQPTMGWNLQLAMTLCGSLLLAVAIGVLLLFMAQAIHAERPLVHAKIHSDFALGAAIAVVLAGLYALTELVVPTKNTPPIYSADWSTYIPWLAVIFNGFKVFLSKIFLIIFAIGSVRFLQSRIKLALYGGLFLIMWIAGSLAADEMVPAVIKQLLGLFSFIVSIELVRRKQLGVLIGVFGVGIAISQVNIANALYASAWIHALISAICCLIVTYGLLRHWHRKSV